MSISNSGYLQFALSAISCAGIVIIAGDMPLLIVKLSKSPCRGYVTDDGALVTATLSERTTIQYGRNYILMLSTHYLRNVN